MKILTEKLPMRDTMFKFTTIGLEHYNKHDVILELLEKEMDNEFTSQIWLKTSIQKRFMYYHMYYDLLMGYSSIPLSILDIGGGLCSLTKKMIKHNNYTLLDIMAHDSSLINEPFLIKEDWSDFNSLNKRYDLIVSNDLLPNVDQRLELFINKFLPVCKKLRLTLTYYNDRRSYKVKRLDADEILTIIPWNGNQVKEILLKYPNRIILPDFSIFSTEDKSIFANNRQVIMVKLRGDLC